MPLRGGVGVAWLLGLGVLVAGACRGPSASLSFLPATFVDEAGDTVHGERGHLDVPLRHARPDGPTIRLAVARFEGRAGAAGPPIVYLEGGPGAAGIHPERMPLIERLREWGDVVTFDQRGTGASLPVLGCGARATLSDSVAPTREAWLSLERTAARRCADSLRDGGHDLGAYNVLESAADVDAIRTALGADRLRLVGISFGTHLALAFIRGYAERVERAVLAGVEGPDHTVKLPSNLDAHLSRMSALVAADPVAGEVLPDLETLVRETIDSLERSPEHVEMDDGSSVLLTAFRFRRLVAGSIVRRQFLRLAPAELGPLADGDFRPLAGAMGPARSSAFGMRAAMDCASGPSPARWRRVVAERRSSLLEGVSDFPFPEVCDHWSIEALGPAVHAPVEFDGPVLFLTGTLDGLTPVSNVNEIRPGFAASGHLTVELMGHEGPGLWFAAPGVLDAVGAFLSGGDPEDATVTAPPIDWVLPPEASPQPGPAPDTATGAPPSRAER